LTSRALAVNGFLELTSPKYFCIITSLWIFKTEGVLKVFLQISQEYGRFSECIM